MTAPLRPLFGPYRPPACEVGGPLFCEIRGWVTVGGISDSPVPWPYMKARGRHSPILCGELVKAVRQEANAVICALFGVTGQTVSKWRKALGVTNANPGTQEAMAAPKRGMPRPAHVRALLDRTGRRASEETRAKLRAAQARRRTG
jgi:hypothetical protein